MFSETMNERELDGGRGSGDKHNDYDNVYV